MTARLAVLVSGSGTNLQAMLDAAATGSLQAEICAVVSDNPQAKGLDRARAHGVAAVTVDFRSHESRAAYDAALDAALTGIAPDIVALAGYMRILADATVSRYHGRMLNVHPSLLPAYPGLKTHARVLAAGDAWHGTTVHFVIPELDAGPPVIQYRVPVRADDTEQSLQARVQAGEYKIFPQALDWLAAERLQLDGNTVMLDGAVLQEPLVVTAAAD